MVDTENDIRNCIGVLQNHGTILYPTDTVWGLGCDAMDEQAIEKIYLLKNRPKEKSMIVLLAEPRDVIQYVAAPHPDIISIIESLTRPTTIIYEGGLGFPTALSNDGSIAIRVTSDPFCKALIKRLRRPLVSTSANISGIPSPAVFREVSSGIKEGCDYVVQYRQDDLTRRQPSQVARIKDDGSLEILRQ